MNKLIEYIKEQDAKPYEMPNVGDTVTDFFGKERQVTETARFEETGVVALSGGSYSHPADLKIIKRAPVTRVRPVPPAPVARVRTQQTTATTQP